MYCCEFISSCITLQLLTKCSKVTKVYFLVVHVCKYIASAEIRTKTIFCHRENTVLPEK